MDIRGYDFVNSKNNVSIYSNSGSGISDYVSMDTDRKTTYNNSDDNIEKFPFGYNKEDLLIISQIGARDFLFPLCVLGRLSLVCKDTRDAVQWRINKSKKIRERWVPKLIPKFKNRLIGHPIKYTGKISKTVWIGEMVNGVRGAMPLDVPGGLFPKDFMNKYRIAFTNACVLVRDKIPFVMMLFLGRNAILSLHVNEEDYIDTGEITEEIKQQNIKKYGENEITHPGRYFVDLNLVTRINPILIGEDFVDEKNFYFCIAERYFMSSDLSGGEITNIMFDLELFIEFFTHIILQFNIVPIEKYVWDDYILTFNGCIDIHPRTTSLIRKKSDKRIIQASNTQELTSDQIQQYLTQAALSQFVDAFTAPSELDVRSEDLLEDSDDDFLDNYENN